MLNFIDLNWKLQPYNNLEHWTESAIDCYLRGCVCEGCDIPRPENCRMKDSVLALVRQYGNPKAFIVKQKKKVMHDKELVYNIQEMLEAGEQLKTIAVKLDITMYYLKKLMDLNGLTIYVHRKRVFR